MSVMLDSWQSVITVFILLSGTCHMKPTQSSGPGERFDSPKGNTEITTPNPNSRRRIFPSQTDFPGMAGGSSNDDLEWLKDYFRRTKMLRDQKRKASKSGTLAPETDTNIHETDALPSKTSLGRVKTINPLQKDYDYDWSNNFPTDPPWRHRDIFNPITKPDINWDDMFRTMRPIPTIDWEAIRRLQEMTLRVQNVHKWHNLETPKWHHDHDSKETDDDDDDSHSDEVADAEGRISPLWWALPVAGVIGLTCLAALLSLACQQRTNRARGNRLPHPLRAPGTLNTTNRNNRRGPSLFITVRPSESRQNLFSTTDPNPSPQSEVLITRPPSSRSGQNLPTPPAYGVCVDEAPPSYNDALVNQTTDATNDNMEINTFIPRPPSYSTVMTVGLAPPAYGEVCGDAPSVEEMSRQDTETADS